jgi:hypothetical protein
LKVSVGYRAVNTSLKRPYLILEHHQGTDHVVVRGSYIMATLWGHRRVWVLLPFPLGVEGYRYKACGQRSKYYVQAPVHEVTVVDTVLYIENHCHFQDMDISSLNDTHVERRALPLSTYHPRRSVSSALSIQSGTSENPSKDFIKSMFDTQERLCLTTTTVRQGKNRVNRIATANDP